MTKYVIVFIEVHWSDKGATLSELAINGEYDRQTDKWMRLSKVNVKKLNKYTVATTIYAQLQGFLSKFYGLINFLLVTILYYIMNNVHTCSELQPLVWRKEYV